MHPSGDTCVQLQGAAHPGSPPVCSPAGSWSRPRVGSRCLLMHLRGGSSCVSTASGLAINPQSIKRNLKGLRLSASAAKELLPARVSALRPLPRDIRVRRGRGCPRVPPPSPGYLQGCHGQNSPQRILFYFVYNKSAEWHLTYCANRCLNHRLGLWFTSSAAKHQGQAWELQPNEPCHLVKKRKKNNKSLARSQPRCSLWPGCPCKLLGPGTGGASTTQHGRALVRERIQSFHGALIKSCCRG